MSRADLIRELCKKKGITVKALEQELGYGNGSLMKRDGESIKYQRLVEIANYFSVNVEYLLTGLSPGEMSEAQASLDSESLYHLQQSHYYSDETLEVAQELFENEDLRLLFDAAKDASAEDLQTVHQMLLALKRKEQN